MINFFKSILTALFIIKYLKDNMTQSQKAQHKLQTTFHYALANMKAMKIVVLIRISKLDIQIQEISGQDSPTPFLLKTPQGELTKQYEIVNYIVNESKDQSQGTMRRSNSKQFLSSESQPEIDQKFTVSLCRTDSLTNARMIQKLFELRNTLFPLLDEFYQFLLGHKTTKKAKYDSLSNKIKKQITKLDADINQYPEIFDKESTNYLSIIITGQLFIICSLVFEEKFRKSKYFLFNMYSKVSALPQFVQVFGKSNYSSKQYIPQEFQEQEAPANVPKSEHALPAQVIKVSQMLTLPIDNSRNDLLYNFFRTTFSQQQSKKDYFPYFWMMFDSLNCCLIELFDPSSDLKFDFLTPRMKTIQHQLDKFINTNVDYGVIGAYQQQKDKNYLIRGLCCLGSKGYQQFENFIKGNSQLKQLKIHRIDVNNQKERNQVQIIWEHALQNTCYEEVNVCFILPI